MGADTDARAKRLAAEVGGVRASASIKPKVGVAPETVRFGMAQNLRKPVVAVPIAEFDAMSDAEVTAWLRAAWGLWT